MLAVFDKPDPLDGPYFEETIFTTPSRLPDAQQAAVTATAAAACSALGLREGPIHAELRIAGRDEAPQVWVMEVAARSIGGLCSRVLRFGAGISLEELILRHATGPRCRRHRTVRWSRGCDDAADTPFRDPPRVSGTEAATRVAGIQGVEITATTGRRIEALPEGGRYLGFLFAHGDTPTQVETALRSAHAELDITIVDESEEPEVTTAPDPAPTTTLGAHRGTGLRVAWKCGVPTMKVLLVSTYELGHQPLHVASPAAALLRHGHEVRCVDLSVQPWDPSHLSGVDAVAISVPMHTAMRLALQVAEAMRRTHHEMPICLYGLYAGASHETVIGSVADRVISGEYEPALVGWVDGLAGPLAAQEAAEGESGGAGVTATGAPQRIVHLQRGRFEVPARHLLPPLDRYARLSASGQERLVGYVETGHGCGFNCRHCPRADGLRRADPYRRR
ncbi:MAG: ATP-grasp domain-containing protein [Microthrixaceae bacterium]|nr:ATP-grasp domain-containing protein [Microthrixaceae bacterium]